MTIKYHFKKPSLREAIDLRDYEGELMLAILPFDPVVTLDKVEKNYYQITINTDEKTNRIVRALGRAIAKTSLRVFVKHSKYKGGKKTKGELFIRKKPKKRKGERIFILGW